MKRKRPTRRVRRSERREAIERATGRVREQLERSPSFRSLAEGRRKQFVRRAERLIEAMAGPEDLRPAIVGDVDFPEFVADLIGGVFEAMVDVSIQQMDAYADLLKNVARGVDGFDGSARGRQQVATMVLMGINRIVVTDGRITVRPHPDPD
jgi:hypothetical protein